MHQLCQSAQHEPSYKKDDFYSVVCTYWILNYKGIIALAYPKQKKIEQDYHESAEMKHQNEQN